MQFFVSFEVNTYAIKRLKSFTLLSLAFDLQNKYLYLNAILEITNHQEAYAIGMSFHTPSLVS